MSTAPTRSSEPRQHHARLGSPDLSLDSTTDTDEGFDSDFADSHPLYARSSGPQTMSNAELRRRSCRAPDICYDADEDEDDVVLEKRPAGKERTWVDTQNYGAGLEPGSQRNKDSVLHYFVATQDNEQTLDLYL
ncbi:hypothetical protein BC830DRAFT_1165907, partial [Chytriomyces sp. MP71]